MVSTYSTTLHILQINCQQTTWLLKLNVCFQESKSFRQ